MGRVKQTGVLIILALLSSLFVATSSASNVSAFTMSVTSSEDASIDISPDKDSDTSTNISVDDVNVVTTCRAGYNLTMSTSVNNNNLYLNGDSTNSTTGTYFTPVNGTSPLNTSTNSWGYFFSNVARSQTPTIPTKTSVFSPVPTSNATPATLKTTTQTASSADINDTLQVYLGVTMNNSITPGSYKMIPESSQSGAENGALVYYLTMDGSCNTVDIAYDGNNADAGTMGAVGTGVIHTNVKDGDNISLIASNFSRTGYGFAGWSFDKDAGTKLLDNDNTNNPVVYGPQEGITLPNDLLNYDTDSDGIVKLYAVWLQSQGNLQGWMGCSNLDTATYDSTTGKLDLTKNSVTALTDQRDHQTYAVARLADGNCWMIENLRLDNNATNPNWGDDNLSQGFGGAFVGLANPEAANFSNSTTANSLYYSGTQSGTASVNIGTSNYPGYRMPRYNNTNTTARASSPTTNDAAMYSYGNYYTWHAVIADLTYNGTNNKSTTNTSLCPTGWHLPTGGAAYASGNTSGVNVTGDTNTFREFYNLGYEIMDEVKTAYEDTPNNGNAYYSSNTTNTTNKTAVQAFRSFPNNFLYSGDFNTSSAYYRGNRGFYWSSTARDYYNSYNLYLPSSSVRPGTDYHNKNYGFSIRCVASDPETYTLAYDANGGSGAPGSQSITANGSATFTISSTTPTRSGYTFAGWIDEKGNEVQPGGTFRTKDTNAILYAIWTNNSCNPTATTIGTGNATTDAVCLQDVKLSMKAALPTADATTGTYTLIDARDGQSYTIAKLADGNLWLTKNLNYGSSGNTLLTSYDTDLPSGKAFKAPASTTSFETTNSSATYVSPKILTNSTYGGYYSCAAAIASTDAYTSSNQNITTSICPKGWDLPTSTMYNNLRTTSGNTSYATMSAAPYSFKYAGYRNGTSFSGQTTSLRLWTSTNYTEAYAYYTTAYDTATYSSNYKRYGESVRCVASNGTATINYYANGGTGTMASETGDINALAVKSNSFTAPTSSQFREWNTKADGTGTTVAAGTALSSLASDGDTINLYAQWDEVYYIVFNANQGTGSMTNQTVVRGAATAIKTNTFTRSGYIFYGWNTAANGSGTFYSDGQKVTNLTTTGNTITLYAVWTDGAYLDTGSNVNQKLKRLAGNSTATSSTQDNTITALVRSSTLPADFTATTENTISDSTSPTPIYAWYDSTNTTIYYYSEATDILMNKTSSNLFREMRALSNLSTISTWDTTKVTNMSNMFNSAGYNATTWSVGDLSSWNTASVTNMGSMFQYAGYNATTWSIGDLSSWNTASVTSMQGMFNNAGRNATTWSVGDLSSWNTASVTTMYGVFYQAGYNATTWSVGDLSSWNTASVTDMGSVFYQAGYNATTWSVGDLSSWNTASVTNMLNMFYDAGHSATTFNLDLSSWNTASVTSMSQMFSYAGHSATTWSVGDLSSWNTASVTSMSQMFSYAGYNATTWSVGDLSSWNTASVTSMSGMFIQAGHSATTWSVGDLSSWNTASVTNMSQMFYYAGRNATTFNLDLSSWNTASVTNMSQMFYSAGQSATTWSVGDLSSWNTASVTNMSQMFYYAGQSATTFTLDLSGWNTASVTNMYQMFSYAGLSATTFTLDLSGWNTASVTNMSQMFYYAGYSATTWSVTIPKTNNGTANGPIANTTSNLYGSTTSVTATPLSGKSFTLAN